MSRANNRVGTTAEKFVFEESMSAAEKLTLRALIDASLKTEVKSASFTAEDGGNYTVTATATVTDPTPSEGARFTVFVRNGTATVGGTGYSTAGTIIIRCFHSGAWGNTVFRSAGNILSADITDATSSATPNTLVLRGQYGQAAFEYTLAGGTIPAVRATTVDSDAILSTSTNSSAGIFTSTAGIDHANFGDSGDNRSFVRRVLGLFGWWRGSYYQTLGAAASLAANRAVTLPDASGVVVLDTFAQSLTNKTLDAPILIPSSSVTPATNGHLVIEATSNTSLTFKLKGSDGTVRSASLTLS